ncbi:serine protease grass-like [Anopheles nili]|uniref:serine protease grass-like n=1 Tax=Anopheles nili TaxID=185578 RepID=UPI00237BCB50|nr:serine protease grass-like [Anopheles nili]
MRRDVRLLIALVVVADGCGDWIFPDRAQFELSKILNKNCGDTPYTDRLKPENGRMFENPWLALLRHPEEEEYFCQGTLITNRHVLTTVVCTHSTVVDETIVILGEYDSQSAKQICNGEMCNDVTIMERLPRKLITHPNFQKDTYEADVALIMLNRNVIYTNNVKPICLPLTPVIPARIHDPITYNALWTVENNAPKQVQIKYIPQKECQKILGNAIELHNGQICAQYAKRIETRLIAGSGSPLLIEHQDRAFQLGILSIGVFNATYLDPYLYVNISSYVNWIHETLTNEYKP